MYYKFDSFYRAKKVSVSIINEVKTNTTTTIVLYAIF